jgi:hypothetical protein
MHVSNKSCVRTRSRIDQVSEACFVQQMSGNGKSSAMILLTVLQCLMPLALLIKVFTQSQWHTKPAYR